ncbi:MAG: aminopeptidase family protein P, partial [Bacteroidota bacterium]
SQKISPELRTQLRADGIHLQPYDGLKDFLTQLPTTARVLLDPRGTSIALYATLEEEQVVRGEAPSILLRAIKNETEVQHIREAMRKDGVALTRLYRWLEGRLAEGPISEVAVAQQLDAFRRAQGDYYGESFSAIVGYGANGAIVHYRPLPEQCADLQPEGILLLDSGGQYLQGTTDITRTTALGRATAEQKRHFTLVLKGHIGLARVHFPHGTRGNQLEVLARQALWEQGLNYGHGTGHGVGFFLNVHEGPQAFGSGATGKAATVLEPGMFTSNEPGYYQTGDYGIRIENLVLCVEAAQTDYGRFLKFETLTLFPIDQQLIEWELLTSVEKQWLEAYHREVYAQLAPRLEAEEREWLRQQCGLESV